jgi:diguanylate cyclase
MTEQSHTQSSPAGTHARPAPPAPTDDERVVTEWHGVVHGTPPDVRRTVAQWVSTHRAALAARYLGHIDRNAETASFVATQESRNRFEQRLSDWMLELFDDGARPVEAVIASQRELGESLARMGYPIRSALRGARRMKAWIMGGLEGCGLPERGLLQAAAYVSNLVDMSIELRNAVFLRETTLQSRMDEAYRLHALSQNIAMERERQRAALMEWGHAVLVEFHRAPALPLPGLAQSEFGLWLRHKAAALFENDAAVQLMHDAVDRVDGTLLPTLEAAARSGSPGTGDLVARLQDELTAVKFSMAELFERHIEVENGRDPLTRLLSRRFLPTILSREVALHRRTGTGSFAVLLLDLDHFKHVNDAHGHEAGDLVLQQAAAAIVGAVRPSDFVFRYGGEEIAVVLVESDAAVAAAVAEKMRKRLADADIAASSGVTIRVTASIGVAVFRGLADYQVLLREADDALYRAKADGRNRVVVA